MVARTVRTTFAAIENHVDTSTFERVEHGLIDRHVNLAAKPRDLHSELLGGQAAAVSKRFKAQLINRTAAPPPFALRILEHADRTTNIEFAVRLSRAISALISTRWPSELTKTSRRSPIRAATRRPAPDLVAPRSVEQSKVDPASAKAKAIVKIGVIPIPPASSRYSGRPRLSSKWLPGVEIVSVRPATSSTCRRPAPAFGKPLHGNG